MSRNASGTYSLPAGQPVVSGTTISSSTFNTLTADLATELTDSLDRSGKGGMLAVLGCVDGTVAAPGITFNSDTDSGLYRIGANNVGLALNGAKVVDYATTGESVTGNITASGVFKSANGAVGAPSYSWTADTTTGLYRVAGDSIRMSVGGADVMKWFTTGVGVVGTILDGDGAPGAPAFSFTADTDTGFYRLGSNNLGLALGGNLIVNFGVDTTVMGAIQATASAANGIGVQGSGNGQGQGVKATGGSNVNATSKGALGLGAQTNLAAGAGAGCAAGDIAWNGTNFLACKTAGTWTLLL